MTRIRELKKKHDKREGREGFVRCWDGVMVKRETCERNIGATKQKIES